MLRLTGVDDVTPLREALTLTPAFLQATGNLLDYKDMQIPLGRRFRWGLNPGGGAGTCEAERSGQSARL